MPPCACFPPVGWAVEVSMGREHCLGALAHLDSNFRSTVALECRYVASPNGPLAMQEGSDSFVRLANTRPISASADPPFPFFFSRRRIVRASAKLNCGALDFNVRP